MAFVLSILIGIIFVAANQSLQAQTKETRGTRMRSYANEISNRMARKLRWGYDTARVPGACTTVPDAAIHNIPRSGGPSASTLPLPICLIHSQACVDHPADFNTQICVSQDAATLLAQNGNSRSNWVSLILEQAVAQIGQSPFSPDPPPTTETNNDLALNPTCLGASCEVRCGMDADCMTFTFCPLTTPTCLPEELITQTVGFIR